MLTASAVTYRTPAAELTHTLSILSQSCVSIVWIIDNSSSDSTREICSRFPKVRYRSSGNIGYGAAHNIAIKEAIDCGAAYHAVLNTDLDFPPDALAEILLYMDANKEVGMVQPRLLTVDGQLHYSCRLLPTPFDLFSRRFLPGFLFKKRRNRYLLKHLDPCVPHNLPSHQGSFMVIRTEALLEAGLFDPRFFMYAEDIDLTRRIHRRWRTIYLPSVSAVHAHRRASYKSLRMTMVHIRSLIRYFNKWGWFHDKEAHQINARTLARETAVKGAQAQDSVPSASHHPSAR